MVWLRHSILSSVLCTALALQHTAVNLPPKIHENKDPTTKIEVAKLLIKTNWKSFPGNFSFKYHQIDSKVWNDDIFSLSTTRQSWHYVNAGENITGLSLASDLEAVDFWYKHFQRKWDNLCLWWAESINSSFKFLKLSFTNYKTGVCILFQEKDVKIEREMMFRNVANHLRTCDIYCRGAAALLDCADDTKCVWPLSSMWLDDLLCLLLQLVKMAI